MYIYIYTWSSYQWQIKNTYSYLATFICTQLTKLHVYRNYKEKLYSDALSIHHNITCTCTSYR